MKNKFKNFAPVYVINLSERIDRKKYIVNHFKKYGVSQYTFIPAVDGRFGRAEIDPLLDSRSSTSNLRDPEIAAILSHLKAIKYWLENSDTPYAIFCEDDVDLVTSQFWNFTWEEFLESIQGVNYEILQMSITNPIQIPIHLRQKYKEYSAGCYLITREYAWKLIKRHSRNRKFLVSGGRKDIVADELIYNSDRAYSVGLFTYKNLESNINPDKVNGAHTRSIGIVMDYWNNHSSLPV